MEYTTNKQVAAGVLQSAHFVTKEVAFSLAFEVEFDPIFSASNQVLVNARAITQLTSVRDSVRALYNQEERNDEVYWIYTAPMISTHPQKGMSYSIITGIDGWLWMAVDDLHNRDLGRATRHVMMALVLFDEFLKLNQ